LSETLKAMMADKEEALAKREEKWRQGKDATCATFIDLTKRALEMWWLGSRTSNRVIAVTVAANIIYKVCPMEALQMEVTQPRNHVVNAATFAPKLVFGNSLLYRLLR
jgi:hypothetical protein